MPFQFTCEFCGNQFTRARRTSSVGVGFRFCSLQCKGKGLAIPLSDRFWPKVAVGGADECWPWLESCNPSGYGQFNINGKSERAHRVAFLLTYGHLPTPCGLHTCDNPPCCNPRHIIEGTRGENVEDMMSKGRGKQRNQARLTDEQVKEIRARVDEGEMQVSLAEEFGVGKPAMSAIINRRTYRHIP